MAVGAYIQAWRESRGQSLEALATEAQVSVYTLEKIEADEVDPGISTLEALAEALKIPVVWLFTHPTSFQHLFADDQGTDVPPGAEVLVRSGADHCRKRWGGSKPLGSRSRAFAWNTKFSALR